MIDIQSIGSTLLSMLNEMSPYILLGFLFAGMLHAFVRPDVMSRHFAGNGFWQSLKAALLGVPLPLCSCGVLPTAIALRRNGASTAATTSFLIATPQTGVDSIAATYSLLGLGFAILRPIAAFLTAVCGGCLMGKLTHEDDIPAAENLPEEHDDCCDGEDDCRERGGSFGSRCLEMLHYGFIGMVGSVGKWLVIGLVIAALITVLVPDDLFVGMAQYPLLAMIAVVIIAVPMYVCATGSIPIALSLMLKGLTPGVAFVFLMAGPAVNFASYTLLSRTLGRQNTLLYIAIIALSAIGIGLVVDCLLPAQWFVPQLQTTMMCCHHEAASRSTFDSICSIVLGMLLIYSLLIRPRLHQHRHAHASASAVKQYRIEGMMCSHCQAKVEQGIGALEGVTSVTVDLDKGLASVEGAVSAEAVAKAVNALGYDFAGEVEDLKEGL
jgi:uncharacterized membrane protein YraQ (UPF0718 family)/copper chaperone CopZ